MKYKIRRLTLATIIVLIHWLMWDDFLTPILFILIVIFFLLDRETNAVFENMTKNP